MISATNRKSANTIALLIAVSAPIATQRNILAVLVPAHVNESVQNIGAWRLQEIMASGRRFTQPTTNSRIDREGLRFPLPAFVAPAIDDMHDQPRNIDSG